jgi:hypothetical protein
MIRAIVEAGPGITLLNLIEAEILAPGIKLFSLGNGNVSGILNSDGGISLSIDMQEKVFHSPSGAARAIEKRSINGWIYWGAYESNEIKPLTFYRDRYIKIKGVR